LTHIHVVRLWPQKPSNLISDRAPVVLQVVNDSVAQLDLSVRFHRNLLRGCIEVFGDGGRADPGRLVGVDTVGVERELSSFSGG
jgi:hypothetical protein